MSRWNPQPHSDLSAGQKSDFYAGYSDAFNRYQFGSGYLDQKTSSSYEDGWKAGQKDLKFEMHSPANDKHR